MVPLRKTILQSPSFQWVLGLAEDILVIVARRLIFYLHLAGVLKL